MDTRAGDKMKYTLQVENRDGIFIIWEGKKSPTIGNAYLSLFKAEGNGYCFPVAKAYRGKKFLRDFTATEINELVRSKTRIVMK